jgi:hypothetical protein
VKVSERVREKNSMKKQAKRILESGRESAFLGHEKIFLELKKCDILDRWIA